MNFSKYDAAIVCIYLITKGVQFNVKADGELTLIRTTKIEIHIQELNLARLSNSYPPIHGMPISDNRIVNFLSRCFC